MAEDTEKCSGKAGIDLYTLFQRKGDTFSFFEQRSKDAQNYIAGLEKNYILNVNEEDFIEHALGTFRLETPALRREDIHTLGVEEVDIDVSQDPFRAIIDRSRPLYLKGSSVTIVVPFEGDGVLFDVRPSSFNYNPPRGQIKGQELHFVIQTLEQNADNIRQQYKRELSSVQDWLTRLTNDVRGFNQSLEYLIRNEFTTWKQKLLADHSMVSALGIPLKKQNDVPTTYSVTMKPKKVSVQKPVVKENDFQPDPIIDEQQYNGILSVLQNMVTVMEKSPSAFVGMGEEDLRMHFLVHLNGQYPGDATGETFNFKGKTDILLTADGRNVFIAECKFWKGHKVFIETIDQLLGYLSWRDTKAAILLFNRNKGFSGVLNKIPSLVEGHPNYKRSIGMRGETEFRYVFKQPNDSNRDLLLTVLAFDVPDSL